MTALKVTHVLYLSEIEGRSAFSGAENHLWVLLPSLARTGADVELLAVLWHGPASPVLRSRIAELRDAGVVVTEVVRRFHQAGAAGSLFTWFALYRQLRRRTERIIHFHLELAWAPLLAALAGCRSTVASVHNDEPSYAQPRVARRLLRSDRFIGRYIAITDHVREYFVRALGIEPGKAVTVYYGLEARQAAEGDRRELQASAGRFVVGFVGRLVEQKNVRLLVDAISRREGMYGVVIGDGPLRHELERAAGGNIDFLGERANAAALMSGFDVLCLPSGWEGLGLVLVEAMVRGVPVCGSRRGAIPEVLGYGEYGLLFEPTVEDLGDCLDVALRERAALRRRAERAKAYAASRFSVSSMVEGTLAAYEHLLAERPA